MLFLRGKSGEFPGRNRIPGKKYGEGKRSELNQNETSRNGEASPQKPKKDILLPTVIALIGVMAAVLIAGASGLIQAGGGTSSSPSSSGGAVSLASAASSEGYAISSGEPAAATGGSVSAQSSASAPSAESGTDSSAAQSGSAAPQAPAGSGTGSDPETVRRTETTGSAVSQAAPQMQPFSTGSSSAGASSEAAPSQDDFSGSAVSRQEFDTLAQGMTYDDVVAAVGGPGTPSDSSFGNTKTYQWDGYGSSGAWVKIIFKSGRLAYKYKFGL
jgi:hypothetical protein